MVKLDNKLRDCHTHANTYQSTPEICERWTVIRLVLGAVQNHIIAERERERERDRERERERERERDWHYKFIEFGKDEFIYFDHKLMKHIQFTR